jgi:hypothetical protein
MIYPLIYTLTLITSTLAHTYLLNPKSRYEGLCIPAVDLNTNCCANKPNIVTTTYRRGQIVRTEWGRNNHIGGFIRYSIVPLSLSDNYNIFNNDSNVFQYNCYAPQCIGINNNFYTQDPYGAGYNDNKCSMNIKIPEWLPDGQYTIQWRWHSGGDSHNQRHLGLRDFISCHDFRISGGTLKQKPQCPLFIGGDASNPNLNACEFFKDNSIDTCIKEKDCFSWYAKAPPKTIMQCPTNILPGGMTNALKGVFLPGQKLPLYVGPTTQTNKNPGNIYINLNTIRQQLRNISPIISPTSQITKPRRCKDSFINYVNNTFQFTCNL